MATLELPESIFDRLKEIAQSEKRDIAEVIENMITQYTPRSAKKPVDWSLIVGIGDPDITDMSTSSFSQK